MGLINSIRAARRKSDAVNSLYLMCVEQARSPAFFTYLSIPDTVDGRFDMIIFHTMLLIRRLRGEGDAADETSQAVLNLMFSDMDRNLREMGVGDLSVGKQVKKMAKAFYGRAEAWETALDAGLEELAAALVDSIYRSVEASEAQIKALGAYAEAADKYLKGQTLDDLLAGTLKFPAVLAQSSAA
jgi:cytochrome b pre-mRNA-processing protein 3